MVPVKLFSWKWQSLRLSMLKTSDGIGPEHWLFEISKLVIAVNPISLGILPVTLLLAISKFLSLGNPISVGKAPPIPLSERSHDSRSRNNYILENEVHNCE